MSNRIPVMVGVEGSPYSRKLRALFRYRRIPFAWVRPGSREASKLPGPKIPLIPQLVDEGTDGKLRNRIDTTPLIRELESEYDGRSAIPTDPVMALLDRLLEDFADEWLTKAMFHYRWAYRPDIEHAAAILPRWARTDVEEEVCIEMGKRFAARQIERLAVVGSNEVTAPVIEEGYRRILGLLDAHLTTHGFVAGRRPGVADFAVFGQLTQLVGFDPTPSAIAIATAPRVVAWVDLVEDLSGMDPIAADWIVRDGIPQTYRALLAEAGRVYVPFLLANETACQSGAERVECLIDGQRWEQKPFPYQRKCLQVLRERHAALRHEDREVADTVLEEAGCARLFAA